MLYKALVMPVLLFGAEIWTMKKWDEKVIGTFERIVLHKVFEAVRVRYEYQRR